MIDEYQDIIDSRDVISRIDELTARQSDADNIDPLSNSEMDELDSLVKLQNEAKDYAEDWDFGATLIRGSYFTDYAKEFAEDIGAIEYAGLRWPFTHINWEAAADELKQDYTEVDYDGITYYVQY